MNVRIIYHISIVIVVHEGMTIHRVINCQGSYNNQQREDQVAFLCGREQACALLNCS